MSSDSGEVWRATILVPIKDALSTLVRIRESRSTDAGRGSRLCHTTSHTREHREFVMRAAHRILPRVHMQFPGEHFRKSHGNNTYGNLDLVTNRER